MITHYKMDYLSNKQSYTLMELINNHFYIDKTDDTCGKCRKPRYIRRAIFNLPPLLIIQNM